MQTPEETGVAATASPLRVLVACEFSGVVRDAFRTLGHDATSAVWEWLEYGDGATKPEPIRRAARERIEEIDRTFIEWDADFAQAEEEVARDDH